MSASQPTARRTGRGCAASRRPGTRGEDSTRGFAPLPLDVVLPTFAAPPACPRQGSAGSFPASTDSRVPMSVSAGSEVPRGSAGGQRRDSHVPALDGVRGLAIILVLFVHFIGDAEPHSAFERVFMKASNYGV